ncbi:metallophosphoesterase [Modicisalibacter luteus]|uniref:metallophosphoesterase n=1 Tax=Modicisalibacter luteus TaxID=453962 RepID=UPI00362DD0A8
MIQTHGANKRGHDYLVGDLHGQYALLQTMLSRVGFDQDKDRLFCVGDLVDRGPDSLACLSLAFEPWFLGYAETTKCSRTRPSLKGASIGGSG